MHHPRTEAAAFKIWQDCNLYGWDRTSSDIAESTNLPVARVASAIKSKNWDSRIRVSKRDCSIVPVYNHEIKEICDCAAKGAA